MFKASFRELVREKTGYDPQELHVFAQSLDSKQKTAIFQHIEKFTLEGVLDFVDKVLPWLSVLYLKFPLETFVLKKAIKSITTKLRSEIRVDKALDHKLKHPYLSNVISKFAGVDLGENSKRITKVSNKATLSNFTDKKLDYRSKNDFWSVEDGYIIRHFKTGEVIDEARS